MQKNISTTHVLTVTLLVLSFAFTSWAMTADEARQDIAWRADLKGLSDTDRTRILDTFEKLQEFITVKEARNLCLEGVKHAKPPAPEERTSLSVASPGGGRTEAGAEAGGQQTAGKSYAAGSGKGTKRKAGDTAGKSAKASVRSDGKLDHQLMGLDRPLFPSILDESQ